MKKIPHVSQETRTLDPFKYEFSCDILQLIYELNSFKQASDNAIKKKFSNSVLNKPAFPEILDFSRVIENFLLQVNFMNAIRSYILMNNISSRY